MNFPFSSGKIEKKEKGGVLILKKKMIWAALLVCLMIGLFCGRAAAYNDFSISNGVLESYCGQGSIVTVPNGVRVIGSNAFTACPYEIKKIILPDTVTTIRKAAFFNCKSLTEIVLPDSLTYIGDCAFGDCVKLREVVLPDSVTTMHKTVFMNCTSLTKVVWPKGITSIEASTFDGCTSLTEVVLPDGITSIGNYAFQNCASLPELNLQGSLTSIGKGAFYGCTNLTDLNLVLSNSITSIGDYAFRDCSSLTELNLPGPITSLGKGAFYGCKKLNLDLVLSDSITSIEERTFFKCAKLRKLILPKELTSIGDYAFDGCAELTKLVLPDKVTSIGSGAFFGCTGLTEINVPKGVTSISASTFVDCTSLTELVLPDKVTSIGGGAFGGCTNLAEIILPDKVDFIGAAAFSGCTKLTEIVLPRYIPSIEANTFSGCTGLKKIVLPDTIFENGLSKAPPRIGERAFYGCTNLTEITLPHRITSIGNEAFGYCEKLKKVHLPSTISSYGQNTFIGCNSLKCLVTLSLSYPGEVDMALPKDTVVYCYQDSQFRIWLQNKGYSNSIILLNNFEVSQCILDAPDQLLCKQGETKNLSNEIKVFPFLPRGYSFSCEIENPALLEMKDSSTVRAVANGDTQLKVWIDGYPQTCVSVKVKIYEEPSVFSLPAEIWIPNGASFNLRSQLPVQPSETNCPVIWETTDANTVSVDENGMLYTNESGTVSVTAKTPEQLAICTVHVSSPFTALSFSQPSNEVYINDELTLQAEAVTPTHTYVNEYMTFASSAPGVAAVDENGVVHGVSTGKATITATSYNGLTATCTVTVQAGRELKLPAGLKEIDAEAFLNVSAQVAIVPDGCESIGARAFSGSTSLSMIEIPASVTFIAPDAFDGCTSVVIRTTPGSYASRYAAEHGLNCVTE